MAKNKKNGEYLHCYIKADIMQQLEDFCETSGQSKTVAVERAIEYYIAQTDRKQIDISKKDALYDSD